MNRAILVGAFAAAGLAVAVAQPTTTQPNISYMGLSACTVTEYIFGGGASTRPVCSTPPTDGQIMVGQTGLISLPKTMSGDATLAASGALTLSSIISAGGPTGDATTAPIITYDAKGRLTAVSSAAISGTGVLDTIGTTRGSILYRGAGGWAILTPGAAGTVLSSNGAGADPSYAAAAGGGTVTSVTCGGLAITSSGVCPSEFGIFNCSLSASVGSNLLTVALKDAAGSDPSATSPCTVTFRNSTATTGTFAQISRTSALSIDTNATGATLGSANSTAFRFWVVVFDNSGTPVLGLYNASTYAVNASANIYSLDETLVASSTAISGSATSAGVFYTPNGTTVTSKAFRVLGFVEYNSSGLATAGTYASAPNFIQAAYPGIKLPGAPLGRCVQLQSPASSTTTSSTFSASNTTVSITPTSAANLIRVTAHGGLYTAVNTNSAQARINRGTTAITSATRLYTTSGGESISPWAKTSLDKPNSTSSTTYAVYFASSNNTNTVGFGFDTDGGIEACEVVG